jgi:N-methylhydantoinase A
LHATRIAEELGISTIVVPPNAGVISAYGLVASDYTKFDAVTRKMKLDEAAAQEAGRIFGEMRARLAAQFTDMKLPGELLYTHTLDMRFVGQAFEVGVEIPADRLGSLDSAYLSELFADAHHRTFMHGATLERPVEIVTLRVGATLPIGAAPRLDRETLAARAPERTKIFHGEAWIDCDRFTAEALSAGQKIAGPAVIEGYTATTWVPPDWTAALDPADNLILCRA